MRMERRMEGSWRNGFSNQNAGRLKKWARKPVHGGRGILLTTLATLALALTADRCRSRQPFKQPVGVNKLRRRGEAKRAVAAKNLLRTSRVAFSEVEVEERELNGVVGDRLLGLRLAAVGNDDVQNFWRGSD